MFTQTLYKFDDLQTTYAESHGNITEMVKLIMKLISRKNLIFLLLWLYLETRLFSTYCSTNKNNGGHKLVKKFQLNKKI